MNIADILSNLLIALSLSADCFAVSLAGCISLKNLKYIQIFRTSLTFGAAQALMPVIGWLIGRTVVDYISGFDHWLAFGLLAIVGGRMIWEAFHEKEEACTDITKGMMLLTLAFATSIDALAVGLSFAFLETNIILASAVIGVVSFFVSHLGFYIGRKAGSVLGQRAKIAGGIILFGIGLKVLISHLIG